MATGLVEPVDGGYGLTAEGLRYIDTISLKDEQPRVQPKIVTQIACQNEKGEWLLYRRNRQPFRGSIGFPYGKIHLGETVLAAAEREFTDKTGLTATLQHRGEVYITAVEKGELISHMLSHLFTGVVTGGELKAETEYGECFWATVDPAGTDYFPGFREELKLLEGRTDHFFEELYFDL